MAADPFEIPAEPAKRERRKATCPFCGRQWVPVVRDLVDVHEPLRVNRRGEYSAAGEVCPGVGDVPEWPKRGRPSTKAAA